MANAKEHLMWSAAASGLTYLAASRYYNRQPNLGEAAVCVGAGTLSGIMPDLLEPAIHPHHRQFCHSLSAATLLVKSGTRVCSERNVEWTQFAKIFTACVIVGYLVHLVLDGSTPKGLPLLGKL